MSRYCCSECRWAEEWPSEADHVYGAPHGSARWPQPWPADSLDVPPVRPMPTRHTQDQPLPDTVYGEA